MVEDNSKLWTQLSLTEIENTRVEVGDTNVSQTLCKGKHCLVAKIITERSFNHDAFKHIMTKV